MIGISVKADVRAATRFTRAAPKQIRFATAKAITTTLFDARKQTTDRMDRDLDRPTPFTKRALRVRIANKENLTGELYAQPIQNDYLQYQVFGGVRTPRGAALAIPPAKKVPGGVRLNKYGNLPKSQRPRALLSRPDTFSGVIGGVAGIWQRPKIGARRAGRLKLLLAYEPRAAYRAGRWRFYETAQTVTRRRFRRNFEAALRFAQRTAR